jgi:hypothetical protein
LIRRFAGCWRLEEARFRGPDEHDVTPYGIGHDGLLIYTPAGRVSAQLHQASRSRFAADDPLAGTLEEARQAFTSYHAYYGTCTIDVARSVISHHVQSSLFPNQAGTTLDRVFTLSDDDMTLVLEATASTNVGGIPRLTSTFTWRRAE